MGCIFLCPCGWVLCFWEKAYSLLAVTFVLSYTSAGLKGFEFRVFTTRSRLTTVRLEYKDTFESTPLFGSDAGLQVTFAL